MDYNKPAGFDRARNREVGKKDITLETMEEAFTSEHWIVRIFKVRGVPRNGALVGVTSSILLVVGVSWCLPKLRRRRPPSLFLPRPRKASTKLRFRATHLPWQRTENNRKNPLFVLTPKQVFLLRKMRPTPNSEQIKSEEGWLLRVRHGFRIDVPQINNTHTMQSFFVVLCMYDTLLACVDR